MSLVPFAVAAVALVAFAVVVLASDKGHKKPVPVAATSYAKDFQRLLDYARPPDQARIIVKGCIQGATMNRHLCTWIDGRGRCHGGVIVITPDGTVPETHGLVPLPAKNCTPIEALEWAGGRAS